ncbi:MAG: hypothetical protein BWY15_01534 [Firmicutes bacterium ADurb.Bin193]|nr:MAG: hypothetical protein BWY15_01534 [Firmicutes bacterium ADurb.Bin193]
MKKTVFFRLGFMVLFLSVMLSGSVFAAKGLNQVSAIYQPVSITYDFNDGAIPGLFRTAASNNARFGRMSFSDEVEGNRYFIIEDGDTTNDKSGRVDYGVQICFGPASAEFDFCIPDYTKTTDASNAPVIKVMVAKATSSGGVQSIAKETLAIIFDKDDDNLQIKLTEKANPSYPQESPVPLGNPLSFDTWYKMKIDTHGDKLQASVSVYNSLGTLLASSPKIDLTSSGVNPPEAPDGVISLAFAAGKEGPGATGLQQSKLYIDNFKFTRERFYIPSKPVISKSGDNITASVVVKNESTEAATAPTLILALYDGAGKLVKIALNDSEQIGARTPSGDMPANIGAAWAGGLYPPAEKTVTCTLPMDDSATAVAYVWADSTTGGMLPYCAKSETFYVNSEEPEPTPEPTPIPPGDFQPFEGRIAYSADGNYHDEDDTAANPFALMLLAHSGFKDKLVHFEYGNHIWLTNQNQLNALDAATMEAAERYGFDSDIFFNIIEDRFAAYNHLKDEILKSTADDPLIICGAGPMHTIYQALNLANQVDPGKLQYVTLVSHSPKTGDLSSNNEHGLYPNKKAGDPSDHDHNSPEPAKVWVDIAEDFPDVRLVIIRGQNGPSDVKKQAYDFCVGNANILDKWMEFSEDANIKWVWTNAHAVFSDKIDVSDAGMIWYLLTGGDQYGNYEKVKDAFYKTYIVNQNFNNEDVGGAPLQWTTSGDVTIQNVPFIPYDTVTEAIAMENDNFTDRLMRFNDTGSPSCSAVKTFEGQSGDVVADFDIIITTDTADEVGVELKTQSGADAVVIKTFGNMFKFKNRSGNWEDLSAFTKDKLHHITIKANRTTGKCTIVVDGRILKDGVNTTTALTDNISQVKLMTGESYQGTVYFDYLKVYNPSI